MFTVPLIPVFIRPLCSNLQLFADQGMYKKTCSKEEAQPRSEYIQVGLKEYGEVQYEKIISPFQKIIFPH